MAKKKKIPIGSMVKVIRGMYAGKIGTLLEDDGTGQSYNVNLDGYGERWLFRGEIELYEETSVKFKVGNRVQFKTWEEMEREYGLNKDGCINITPRFIPIMTNLCGTYAVIKKIIGNNRIELENFTANGDKHWNYCIQMIKLAREFQVGDRVRAIKNISCSSINKGFTGTVVRSESNRSVGVSWDKDIGGHNCDGLCQNNHGWYVENIEIEFIEEPTMKKTSKKQVSTDISAKTSEELSVLIKVSSYKYMARDYDGRLFVYAERPYLDIGGQQFYSKAPYKEILQRELFRFIKQGESPVEINKIIKEVENG